jgi:hypothetical protein
VCSGSVTARNSVFGGSGEAAGTGTFPDSAAGAEQAEHAPAVSARQTMIVDARIV